MNSRSSANAPKPVAGNGATPCSKAIPVLYQHSISWQPWSFLDLAARPNATPISPMENWTFYGSSDSGPAYFVSTKRPRFVLELELGSDGLWRGAGIWAIDTVSVEDVEQLMREVGISP